MDIGIEMVDKVEKEWDFQHFTSICEDRPSFVVVVGWLVGWVGGWLVGCCCCSKNSNQFETEAELFRVFQQGSYRAFLFHCSVELFLIVGALTNSCTENHSD